MLRYLILVPALVLAAPASADVAPQPESTIAVTAKTAVTADRFMVVTANPLASEAGQAVLAEGGNAIDAMVAVQLVLNLVEPQSSGIGGGSFLLYRDAGERSLYSFDGRETAPAAAGPDYFLDPASGEPLPFWTAVVGGRSVGVPGTLALLEAVHARFGSRPWAELVEPAILLAEEGFTVSPRLAGAIAEAPELDRFPAIRDYFFKADGSPLAAGDTLRNPAFAETLRRIADNGAAYLHEGELAVAIVDAVTSLGDHPGLMTTGDLAGYRVVQRSPVCAPYRTYEVCGMGPPSSGGLTVAQMLGLLEHFDLPGMGYGPEAVHLFLEAAKLAHADRDLYMADSDFVAVPEAGLLDPAYLTARAQLIDPRAAMAPARAGNPPWRDRARLAPQRQAEVGGTSHFVIVDEAGNAVSMTSSIEAGFGSRIMVGGFLLNNELTDFSFRPEIDGRHVANRVEGGKRPRSSMAPTIVLDATGEPVLLAGSPGGSRIINYVAKTLVAVLDWGMELQEAIELGHFVNRNGDTDLEAGSDALELQPALEVLGHGIVATDLNSGLHGIERRNGRLVSGVDPRREGVAAGE